MQNNRECLEFKLRGLCLKFANKNIVFRYKTSVFRSMTTFLFKIHSLTILRDAATLKKEIKKCESMTCQTTRVIKFLIT